MRSCRSLGLPGEVGKLHSVLLKSAWPIRGAHSAWACQAARSEGCLVGQAPATCGGWCGWRWPETRGLCGQIAQGPQVSFLYPRPGGWSRLSGHMPCIWSFFSEKLTVWFFTFNQSSEVCDSMTCTSARWIGRTLPGAGCPSSWSCSMACSVVAVSPACRVGGRGLAGGGGSGGDFS